MTFNVDWTSRHIAIWSEHLKSLKGKPNLRALEIGVLEGRSTAWFCDNILTGDGCVTTCVDPFLQTLADGYFHMRMSGYKEAKDLFIENVARFGPRVELFHGRSIEFFAQPELPTSKYDLAYIDGSHTLVDASVDLYHTWAMTKPGGLIVVDDYEYTDVFTTDDGVTVLPGVKPATDAWLATTGCEVVHRGYQLIARKA